MAWTYSTKPQTQKEEYVVNIEATALKMIETVARLAFFLSNIPVKESLYNRPQKICEYGMIVIQLPFGFEFVFEMI
jgi:hypothetical protein